MQVINPCRFRCFQDWVLYLGAAQRNAADARLLQALQEAAIATGLPLSGAHEPKLMQGDATAVAPPPATQPLLATLQQYCCPATRR
jgi:hypothetical protein